VNRAVDQVAGAIDAELAVGLTHDVAVPVERVEARRRDLGVEQAEWIDQKWPSLSGTFAVMWL
jgi:hypothetical protein